jgi:hypothetical protein
MFTTIVASDVQSSGGIGTDNMSAIVIKFDWINILDKDYN